MCTGHRRRALGNAPRSPVLRALHDHGVVALARAKQPRVSTGAFEPARHGARAGQRRPATQRFSDGQSGLLQHAAPSPRRHGIEGNFSAPPARGPPGSPRGKRMAFDHQQHAVRREHARGLSRHASRRHPRTRKMPDQYRAETVVAEWKRCRIRAQRSVEIKTRIQIQRGPATQARSLRCGAVDRIQQQGVRTRGARQPRRAFGGDASRQCSEDGIARRVGLGILHRHSRAMIGQGDSSVTAVPRRHIVDDRRVGR